MTKPIKPKLHSPGARVAKAIAQPPLENYLLEAAPSKAIAALGSRLQLIPLSVGHLIYAPMKPIRHVYFPTAGLISVVAAMKDGSTVEVGLVGKDGMTGIALLLGVEFTRNEAVVQVAGSAYVIEASLFSGVVQRFPGFQNLLLRYVESRMSQIALTAACNRLHHVEERCSRWLLSVSDRVESDSFFLTQEYMATMLGVRRAGVTLAAGILQKAGIIDYRRGRMRIIDRERLEATACECYETGKAEMNQLFAAPKVARNTGTRSAAVKPSPHDPPV